MQVRDDDDEYEISRKRTYKRNRTIRNETCFYCKQVLIDQIQKGREGELKEGMGVESCQTMDIQQIHNTKLKLELN